jgi:hypothetical protein
MAASRRMAETARAVDCELAVAMDVQRQHAEEPDRM